MELQEFFETAKGLGVLATADSSGKIDAAIYARPHIIDEKTIAFIMRQHVSYSNLQSNPYACYLFRCEGTGYAGKRLYLKKNREETDLDLIEFLQRRYCHPQSDYDQSERYIVYFTIENIRPLIGDAEQSNSNTK